MAKKKRSGKKKDKLEHISLGSLPDWRAMDQIMRQFLGGLEDEDGGGDTPSGRAQDLVYQAFDSDSPAERARLARQALKISPDCADAFVLLAENAESPEEALELYKQGMDAGERAIGKKAFKECEGLFWGYMETRPYMRAREGLAQCLWHIGRHEEAADHYRQMLRLNPNDNQGVRYSLATLLLELELHAEFEQLLAQYEEDDSAEWFYGRALLAFREEGESARAVKLLKRAVKANKHVPRYLLGQKQLPRDLPPYISRGGDDEAVSYTHGNRRAWLNTPGAVSWLRKTLDVSLPRPPKPRRPSWPQLKLALRACPQEQDEVWQVDALPVLAAGQGEPEDDLQCEQEEGAPCVLVAVGRASGELIALEPLVSEPKPGDLWDFLTSAIRKPQQGEPRRPATIEVCQSDLHSAWKAKLKQIGIECLLSSTLDAIEPIRNDLASQLAANDAGAPDAASSAEEILALPFEPGEVWQADVRPMPLWISGEGVPYRPWATVVVTTAEELVLAHDTTPERPPAEYLWQTVRHAIGQPAVGQPHRPGTIEVACVEQQQALRPHLDACGIECVVSAQLEHVTAAFDSMGEFLAGQGGPPSILAGPGMKPEQVAGFYAAAAEFYRRRPWQKVPGDTIIKIECDKFQSGPWYAVVMGQSGVQQGLAVYEDLAFLQAMITGDAPDEESARGMSALSMMFSEAFEISPRDLDAAETHNWTVAGPEAYPMVIHTDPGFALRPPLVWELELLEACLRTIPDFIAEKSAPTSKAVATASGTLPLRLSWAANAANSK
jgi:tetratricopeptide (TPR) repeat protein